MEEKKIERIINRYRMEVLDPRIEDQKLVNELTDSLENIIREETETPKHINGAETGKQLDIPKIDPNKVNNVGDIYFSHGKYFIGSPDTGVKGRINSSKGQVLLYFLANISRKFSEDEIRTITGTINKKPILFLVDLKSQISGSSACYLLETYVGNKDKPYAVMRKKS